MLEEPFEGLSDDQVKEIGLWDPPYSRGQRLICFLNPRGGSETVVLVGLPSPRSSIARVRRGDGVEDDVSLSYLYPETARTEAFVAARATLHQALDRYWELLMRGDLLRSFARVKDVPEYQAMVQSTRESTRQMLEPDLHPYPPSWRRPMSRRVASVNAEVSPSGSEVPNQLASAA